jgi:hypothetical protein
LAVSDFSYGAVVVPVANWGIIGIAYSFICNVEALHDNFWVWHSIANSTEWS